MQYICTENEQKLQFLLCRTLYDITDDFNVIKMWNPVIAFGGLLDYEKTKVFGGEKLFSMWYIGKENRLKVNLLYSEEVQLSFSCEFQYENFPFDSHNCTLEFTSQNVFSNQLKLQPLFIVYEKVSPHIKRSYKDDPIVLNNLPHPFEFQFKFLPPYEKIGAYNYSHPYVGMEIKMVRNTLGELLSGYYYPMAAFAFLSMISFLIKPDIVSNSEYDQTYLKKVKTKTNDYFLLSNKCT